MEEKTSMNAKVHHDTYFYFDYNGESYRGRWFTIGTSYAGLRIWKKERCKFIISFNLWALAVYDVIKQVNPTNVQIKNHSYNAIKTYDRCVAALEETSHASAHTEKIIK